MNKTKELRKPIKFPEGVVVNVVFDYDPSTAKSFEQDSKFSESGKATKYMISVNKDEIIFATPALYEKLRNYNEGDNVDIMFADRKWQVTSNSTTPKKEDEIQRVVENTETIILLRKIALDIDLIKGHLFGNEDKKEDPKDDEETDF